jgi:hypothetical protein
MACCAMVMCAAAGVCIRVTTVASLAPAAVFLIPRLLKARENSLLVQIIVTFSSLPLRLCLSIHVFMAHAAVNMASFFHCSAFAWRLFEPAAYRHFACGDHFRRRSGAFVVTSTGTQVSASVASALIRPVVHTVKG